MTNSVELKFATMRWVHDESRVVTLTIDDPENAVNTLSPRFHADLALAVEHLEVASPPPVGVVVRSAKRTFLAGGDLRVLRAIEPSQREGFGAGLARRKLVFRRLEQLPFPVVAVIDGAALGGGLELALACHHRVAVRRDGTVLGLPEISLGLLPGAGGVTRLCGLINGDAAWDLITTGRRISVDEAAALGLVEAADGPDAAMVAAHAWIAAHPRPRRPWDGTDWHPAGPAAVANRIDPGAVGAGSSALAEIRTLVVDGASRDFDSSLDAETQALARLVVSESAKATIDVLFFDTTRVRGRHSRGDEDDGHTDVTFVAADDKGLALAVETDLVARLCRAGVVPEWVKVKVDVGGPACASGAVVLLRADRALGGGLVAEVWAGDTEVSPLLAALARAGVVALERTGTHESLADLAIPDGRAPGTDDDLAKRWVGLASLLVYPEDLEVAAVRLGGFPARTGGPRRYLARHETTSESGGTR